MKNKTIINIVLSCAVLLCVAFVFGAQRPTHTMQNSSPLPTPTHYLNFTGTPMAAATPTPPTPAPATQQAEPTHQPEQPQAGQPTIILTATPTVTVLLPTTGGETTP